MGRFEYAVENEINILNYGIDVDYKFNDKLYFNAILGLSTISSFTYYQYEKLVKPSNRGYFVKEDGSKSRLNNEFRGDLEIDNINPVLSIGAYYEMPLNKKKTLNLTPSLYYTFQFGEIVPETSWNFSGLRLGLGINYYFHKDSMTVIDEKQIDRTLLLAPTFVRNNTEKLKNSIQYSNYVFDIDLFDIELTPKKKSLIYNKIVTIDDSLRFYYKFDKFSNIKEISLNLSDNKNTESIILNTNNNKVDFALSDISSKFSEKITANLKLVDKQRVYVKNAFTIVEKDFYSNSIVLNFELQNKVEAKITLFRWKGELGVDNKLEYVVNNINNKKNIKYIYSNTDLGLDLVRILDNAKIVYNPNNEILQVLQELISNSNYIIVYEI